MFFFRAASSQPQQQIQQQPQQQITQHQDQQLQPQQQTKQQQQNQPQPPQSPQLNRPISVTPTVLNSTQRNTSNDSNEHSTISLASKFLIQKKYYLQL